MHIDANTLRALRWSRRGLSRLVGGTLALLGGFAAAASSPDDQGTQGDKRQGETKRRKKRKFRTVTRTFRNTAPITINDATTQPTPANPYPSPIQVSGLKRGKLLDVNVTLKNISHAGPGDIDLLLVAPNGRRAVIMSDSGGAFAVSNLTLTLDDQAPAFLSGANQLRAGRFIPTNFETFDDPFPLPGGSSFNDKLATFRGINPNGRWRLFAVDDSPGATGTIGGWSLTIKARVRR